MPLLDRLTLNAMLKVSRRCRSCGASVRRNYCRDHDEFFWDFHNPGCREEVEHWTHCTYRGVLGGQVPGPDEIAPD